VGGIPPAEPREFRSDIFKQTPPSLAIASYGEYGPLLDRKGGVRNAKNSKFKKKRGSASA